LEPAESPSCYLGGLSGNRDLIKLTIHSEIICNWRNALLECKICH